MTELLYLKDHCLHEFDGRFARVEGDYVTLDKAAFYPTGGRQPNDIGIIRWDSGEAQAVDVSKKSGTALHRVKGSVPHKRSLFTA